MRLIDGDALIAWTKKSQQMTSKVRNIICKIESMPSADRPSEWIPCSERLPEKDGFYLVTITDGEQIAVCKMPFVDSEWRDNLFDDEVLAWMPLPEPWKGADGETD